MTSASTHTSGSSGSKSSVDRPRLERAPGTVDRDTHEVDGRPVTSSASRAPARIRVSSRTLFTEPFEPGRLGEGVLEQLPALGRVEARILGEDRRGRGLDRGERRPQVVGDPGEEPGARPVELALHALLAGGGLDPFELEGGRRPRPRRP